MQRGGAPVKWLLEELDAAGLFGQVCTLQEGTGETMRGKKILLGVSGGIAAYKAAQLARAFRREGAEVRVVMTPAATEFVTPLTFEALTGNPVSLDMFGPRPFESPQGALSLTVEGRRRSAHEHVDLARWAGTLVIAPATADVIAKLAVGLADDLPPPPRHSAVMQVRGS